MQWLSPGAGGGKNGETMVKSTKFQLCRVSKYGDLMYSTGTVVNAGSVPSGGRLPRGEISGALITHSRRHNCMTRIY